jgi:hypothetical protein
MQSHPQPLPSEQSLSCCIRSDGEAGARMLRVVGVAVEVVLGVGVGVEFAVGVGLAVAVAAAQHVLACSRVNSTEVGQWDTAARQGRPNPQCRTVSLPIRGPLGAPAGGGVSVRIP